MNSKVNPNEDWSVFDFNWYFADRHMRMIAVASGGGLLPSFLHESFDANDQIHRNIMESEVLFQPIRNRLIENFIDFSEVDREEYFRTFDQLASRGFYAFDKVNLSEPRDDEYVLVSYPKWGGIGASNIRNPLLHYILAVAERTNALRSYRSALKILPIFDVNLFGDRPPFSPVGSSYSLPTSIVKIISTKKKLFGP